MASARILVVEDESIVAKDIEDTLKSQGYDVPAIALSGEQAIQKAEQLLPDLVLMDIVLRGNVDGVEAAEQIRDRFDIPVVYLTAHTDDETLKRAKLTEPFAYITKPFEVRELRTNIEMALYRHKMNKRLRESEKRYRYLFDQSPVGIGLATPDGKVIAANKTMEAITGYFEEELKKINLADAYEDPQDRKRLLETIKRYGCAVDFYARLRRKDGTVYDALLNVSRVCLDGQDLFQTICTDITERKRAEEALRRSERQASAAVEAARGFTFSYDIGTGKVSWGGAIQEITGYTPEEFAQVDVDGWAEMIHADDRDRVLPILQKAIDELDRATAEYRFRTKNGGYVTLSSISLTEKQDGQAVRLVGILQDVTERKRAQEALRESEERFRDIACSTGDLIWEVDESAVFSYCSEGTENVLGYPAGEVVGKTPFDFMPAEEARRVSAIIGKIFEQRKPIKDFEGYCLHRDGKLRCLLTNGVPVFDEKGNLKVYRGICKDITERERAEEALRSERNRLTGIFEAMVDGVYIVNQEHDIEYVNPALEKDFGRWQGRKCYEYFHDRKESCPWCKNKDVFAGKTVRWEWYSFKNERTYDLIDTPLRNSDGSVSKLEIFRDITERKRTEEALRESEKLAAKGQLAAQIAHEVNNPLAGIKNSFMLIKDAISKDHPHYRYVGLIDKEIGRMAQIVRGMFDLYRPESEEPREFSLDETIRDVVELLEVEYRKRNVLIGIGGKSAVVTLSEAPLRQVLYNIIKNAIEASPPGGEVEIDTKVTDDAITISVRDEGEGISEQVGPYIFEPLFTTKKGLGAAGLGLGLSVSKNIVEAMGGSVYFDSKTGLLPRLASRDAEASQGTVFSIIIPLRGDRKGA